MALLPSLRRFARSCLDSWDERVARPLWFGTERTQPADFCLARRTEFPFRDAALPNCDEPILEHFRRFNAYEQFEYLCHYRAPVTIEPRHGWMFSDGLHFIRNSLAHSEYVRPPSLLNALTLSIGNKQVPREKILISLRDPGELNYWHFHNDILGKLRLLEELDIDAGIPMLVSSGLYAKPYFQYYLEASPLKNRKWIVQSGNEFIGADKAIFCQSLPHSKTNFDYALRLLSRPPGDASSRRKIFLTRSARTSRYVGNSSEIEEISKEFGFDIVDTEQMSPADQIALFSEARYIIGIHGAGLTNIIYRNSAPLDLLEVFPPHNCPPHYYWLALVYGYGYGAIQGERSAGATGPQGFRVDPLSFRIKVGEMLEGSTRPCTPDADRDRVALSAPAN